MKKFLCLLLVLILSMSMVACSNSDTDSGSENTEELLISAAQAMPEAQLVDAKKIDDKAVKAFNDFSIKLFTECDDDSNIMISPISVLYALSMTANGANNLTQEEMIDVLGENLSMEEINVSLKAYMDSILDDDVNKVKLANSIWYNSENNNLHIKENFLQTLSNYYESEIFKLPFDDMALHAINKWVEENTDNMIKDALDKISEDSFMFLINAIVFDAKWADPFYEYQVKNDIFTNSKGEAKDTAFMFSSEDDYLENEHARGFIKYYENYKYAFVAMLPNEGVDIDAMMKNMTGEDYQNFMHPVVATEARISMPKFTYDYNVIMNDILNKMGIKSAFSDQADFSNMADSEFPIRINRVIHKTHIENNEAGTRAAAVTIVEMENTSAMPVEKTIKEVYLNRPFVYMIVDTETKLPLFIGALRNIE